MYLRRRSYCSRIASTWVTPLKLVSASTEAYCAMALEPEATWLCRLPMIFAMGAGAAA